MLARECWHAVEISACCVRSATLLRVVTDWHLPVAARGRPPLPQRVIDGTARRTAPAATAIQQKPKRKNTPFKLAQGAGPKGVTVTHVYTDTFLHISHESHILRSAPRPLGNASLTERHGAMARAAP